MAARAQHVHSTCTTLHIICTAQPVHSMCEAHVQHMHSTYPAYARHVHSICTAHVQCRTCSPCAAQHSPCAQHRRSTRQHSHGTGAAHEQHRRSIAPAHCPCAQPLCTVHGLRTGSPKPPMAACALVHHPHTHMHTRTQHTDQRTHPHTPAHIGTH